MDQQAEKLTKITSKIVFKKQTDAIDRRTKGTTPGEASKDEGYGGKIKPTHIAWFFRAGAFGSEKCTDYFLGHNTDNYKGKLIFSTFSLRRKSPAIKHGSTGTRGHDFSRHPPSARKEWQSLICGKFF